MTETSESLAADLARDRLAAQRTKKLAEMNFPQSDRTSRPETQVCEICGATFLPEKIVIQGRELFRQRNCFTCVEDVERADAEKAVAAVKSGVSEREAAWQALCPWEYRTTAEGGNTDLQRVSRECPKFARIRDADLGRKGLLIIGETDKHKTRATWRLMRREWDRRQILRAFTAGEFGRQYADASSNFNRTPWFNDLATADVLFLDDLGKSEWTVGVFGEFFDLLEARMKHGRPTIVTSNEVGPTLQAKAKDQNTAIPLIRRLRDLTKIVL